MYTLGPYGPDHVSELVVEYKGGLMDYTPLSKAPERREGIDNTPPGRSPDQSEACYQTFGIHSLR